jgi:hypothetical protein
VKIKIEHTVELSGDDLAALKIYFNEIKHEGETFREWFKSSFVACGHCFMDEKAADYGRWTL